MNNFSIEAIGYIAQGLFSARLLVQWIKSEKVGRVLSPTIFWQLSLFASFLLMVYGILKQDFPVVLGQAISYIIYIRNLKFKRAWEYLPSWFKISAFAFPLFSLLWLIFGNLYNLESLISSNPLSIILIWGGAGQLIFTFRFVYQWYYSEKVKRSVLPVGFWYISLFGSLMIGTYAIYNELYPILLGQLFGFVIYIRNVVLHLKSKTIKKS